MKRKSVESLFEDHYCYKNRQSINWNPRAIQMAQNVQNAVVFGITDVLDCDSPVSRNACNRHARNLKIHESKFRSANF